MTFLSRQLTKGQSQDSLWKKLRKTYITATDVATQKGGGNFIISKFKTNYNKKAVAAMRHGNLTEDITKEIFNKMFNVNVKDCGLIKHKKYGNEFAASPDGYFYHKDSFGNDITTIDPFLIEIKNPYSRVINFLLPYKYWIQIQMQLFCTDLQVCYYIETSIKFKEIFTDDDKEKYNYWGECVGELKEDGKYWYLENFFVQEVKRDDKWLNENIPFLLSMYQKLNNHNKKINRKRGRKRTFREIEEDEEIISSDYYLDENYMHNYVNNDTLSDYLNMYAHINYDNIKPSLNPFLKEVANWNKQCAGILRYNLMEHYKVNYSIIQLPQKSVTHFDVPFDLHKMTLQYMKENYDIIINPYLIDQSNKMYTNTFAFVKGRVLCQETNINNIKMDSYYPYIFKKKRLKTFSNRADKLTNGNNMKEVKCSALYNIEMINKFQNSKIHRAFILGWGYEVKEQKIPINHNIELFKNKVQCVVYKEEKDLIEKSKRALKWIKLCRNEGDNWDIYNLDSSVPKKYHRYLFPNVCNKNIWYDIKKEFAKEYNDVGLIWGIGSEKRMDLHSRNIYSWDDPKFLEYVDEKFVKNRKIIKHMIKMSKNKKGPKIFLPNKKIKNLVNNWNENGRLEFFVDFETINTSVNSFEIIYLIGMSIKYPNGDIDYLSYFVPELTTENELDIIERWMVDMKRLTKRYCRGKYEPSVFCWGNAEIQMLNSALDRFQKLDTELNLGSVNFIDMCKMFKQEPILIKGAKEGFGLKHILTKMVENELIEEVKYEDFCNRGDISITHALDYYNRKDNDIKNAIIKYNEIDCVALMKIVDKVREFC